MNSFRSSICRILALTLSAASVAVAQADSAASPAAIETSGGSLIAPENQLTDPAQHPEWRELFAQLAPSRTRQSRFEERRYFPFRKAPVVLQGEIRLAPDRGLSLRYLEPEPRVMIVDDQGLLMRDPDGRERPAPSDSRAQAATAALVSVLRFDVAALQREFAVYGQRSGKLWTLAFVPRAAELANLVGTLLVTGSGGQLTSIEMIKSPRQRIEITIRDTVEDVAFTADTLRRFFR